MQYGPDARTKQLKSKEVAERAFTDGWMKWSLHPPVAFCPSLRMWMIVVLSFALLAAIFDDGAHPS